MTWPPSQNILREPDMMTLIKRIFKKKLFIVAEIMVNHNDCVFCVKKGHSPIRLIHVLFCALMRV